MSKQAEIKNRIFEIADRLDDGTSTGALVQEYSEKWKCTERNVFRTIALAKDKVMDKLKDRELTLDIIRSEVLADDFDYGLLSCLELETELCRIVAGGTVGERWVYGKEGHKKVDTKATIGERINAINLLMKIRKRYIMMSEKEAAKTGNKDPWVIEVKSEEDKRRLERI